VPADGRHLACLSADEGRPEAGWEVADLYTTGRAGFLGTPTWTSDPEGLRVRTSSWQPAGAGPDPDPDPDPDDMIGACRLARGGPVRQSFSVRSGCAGAAARLRILVRASTAVSSASGRVCRYFSVVAMLP
jgi:hypothetical protein